MKNKNAFVYSCANLYQLRKYILIMKKNKIKYTVYGEYFICSAEIPKRSYSDYYIDFVGEIEWNKKFTCDDIKKHSSSVNEIKGYNSSFKRTDKYYILTMPNGKQIRFKRKKEDEAVLSKIFTTKDFEFFEKSYNEQTIMTTNNGDDIDLDDVSKQQKEDFNLRFEDNYDDEEENIEEQITDEALAIIEKDEMKFYDYEQYMLRKNFDITKMLKYFTKNKAIILILLLLKLSYSAISRLMNSSVVYITLEEIRIAEKIQKLLENGKR
jgi:hypothetical protein